MRPSASGVRMPSDEPHQPALPPGQHARTLHRFGLPEFAARWPQASARPVLTVGGDVRFPGQVELGELAAAIQRREQRSDLHCVTTWNAVALRWSGLPFREVYELLADRVRPHPTVGWLLLTGLDGYRACLALQDALADDVLLADRLDGADLQLEHGAPLRLVTPAHYGYKSVKHLCTIELRRRYTPGTAGWAEHPRGRVLREERSRGLPGWAYRRLWHALLPLALQAYDRAARQRPATH